jgi:hypothetical protein
MGANMRSPAIQVMLAAVMLMVATQEVSAQFIMGAGKTSCGDWLRYRSLLDRPENLKEVANSYQVQAWVDGFLSGFNVAKAGGPDILSSKPPAPDLYSWVDNYCRAKPLNVVGDAVLVLAKELESRALR